MKGKVYTVYLFKSWCDCGLLICIAFLQTFTAIHSLHSVGLCTAMQWAVSEVPHALYVFDERPTCDVIDNERCSGSSERKIPRALAT